MINGIDYKRTLLVRLKTDVEHILFNILSFLSLWSKAKVKNQITVRLITICAKKFYFYLLSFFYIKQLQLITQNR